MEPSQKELTLDESIKQVMKTLPSPIRNYLGQGKYSMVASRLMTKYGLRVDQGGILEREIMLLLMGIENPDDFAASLKNEATLSEDVVRVIMTDVNQEIFLPLQEEMRRGETSTPESAKPVAPPVPLRHIINKIPMPPAGSQTSTMREGSLTSINPAKLLEDHEEPHIEFAQVPVMTAPASRPTPVSFSPRPMMPTPNLPGAVPPAPPQSLPASPPRPAPPVRPYSSDPYREPIDGKE